MRVGKNHSDSLAGRYENKFPLAAKGREELMMNLVNLVFNTFQYIFRTTYNISYI